MIKHKKISFLFTQSIFLSILILLAYSEIVNATTYYVATNGSNTAPYETWTKAATSIQTAINAASGDDIIMVGSSDGHGTGIYTENVIVNKRITIQSENGFSTTTVRAASSSSHVFEVLEDGITITGFSIYGATGFAKVGIYLNSVNDCIINNNRCGWDVSHNNFQGIWLASSNTCTISNSTASYNSGEGIFFESSDENTLTSNTVSNNSSDGISLTYSSSNTLNSNTINNNTWDGVHMVPSCNNNILTNNTSSNNGSAGFLIVTSAGNDLDGNTANSNANGFCLATSSNDNTLTNNIANSNVGNGILLQDGCSGNNLSANTVTHNQFGFFVYDCSNNTISSNIMNDNDGRSDGDGIMLSESHYNILLNNTANNDPGDGIEFYNSSHNTITGNTIDNRSLSDPGASMRINYYSSYNTIINNTVINGAGGIVLEESSNYNFISNNTVTNNTGRGFEFWENASYNTLTRNKISDNGTYGIWLPSGNNNTIYLNDISNNSTANIFSESTTTTWHSPTRIYYDYNSGTTNKGYLGNYYSDGNHTGSNGVGGFYIIPNDNSDAYQLINTFDNYSLQAWWLNSDNNMYIDNVGNSRGSVIITNGGNNIWKADQVASSNTSFSGNDNWNGQLVFTAAPTGGHTFTIEIGSSTDGIDFIAGGPNATVTGDGSSISFTFTTNASAFTVLTGNYLALRITSNHAEYSISTGGAWSFVSSPGINTTLPLPVELTTFTSNVSDGIVTLNWQTETEVNNFGFDVERQDARVNTQNSGWKKIGFVVGHGNSNSPKNYSFTDNNLNSSTEFFYKLKQIDIDGIYEYSDIIEVSINGITDYVLEQNYPNPFNPSTSINYSLSQDGNVTLKVYDGLGNEIVQLENGYRLAGSYIKFFDASDLTSGIYFYTIKSDNFVETKKMILLK